MAKKRCSNCGDTKPLSEFSKRKAAKDGLQSQCKACVAAYDKQYREENPEKCAARCKKYYEEHREEMAAYGKKYREENQENVAVAKKRYCEENREEVVAYNQRYYEENREQILASAKRYNEENPESVAAYQKRYYETHLEKVAARNKQWKQANPEKNAASSHRRRARLAGVVSEAFDITDLFERDGQQCRYCGATENLTTEHIVPISEGGPNILDNCVVACRSCNSSKKDKSLIEWLATESKLHVLNQAVLL